MPKKPSKVTTSATKHRLPLPAGHPQRKAKPKKRKPAKRDLFDLSARDLAYAKKHKLGIYAPPTIDVPPRAIPCGEDTPSVTFSETFTPRTWVMDNGSTITFSESQDVLRGLNTPPDTSSYPWPLKALWKLDKVYAVLDTPVSELWTRFRSRLAQWVTP